MILGMLVVGFVFGVLPVGAGLALFQLMLDTQAAQAVQAARPATAALRLVPPATEWAPPSSRRARAA